MWSLEAGAAIQFVSAFSRPSAPGRFHRSMRGPVPNAREERARARGRELGIPVRLHFEFAEGWRACSLPAQGGADVLSTLSGGRKACVGVRILGNEGGLK